jgi:NitT/TauT family transport system substrate-binding protein
MFILLILLSACGPSTESSSHLEDKEVEKPKELKEITIVEPVHLMGYLPLYLAINEGYFEKEGLDVDVITATGGGHVTSLVSGEVWGNIGGPESNQMANKGNSDPIVSVVNVVNRANVYLMAKKGESPSGNSPEDLTAYLTGKTVAAGRYGGSPNLLTRWYLMDRGLNPDSDVRLEEPADAAAALSLVETGQADLANGAEPQIIEGITKGVWDEPFYGFPELGDYSYSVISVKKSTIEEEPEVVQSFVNAIKQALDVTYSDRELAIATLKSEFPTLSDEAILASIQRAYDDFLWSEDGYISEESVEKVMDVVEKTGVYTDGYEYSELIDMQFVND